MCRCFSPVAIFLQPVFFWMLLSVESCLVLEYGIFSSPSVCVFCLLHCTVCGILIPKPGSKPMPPAVEVLNLNHWMPGTSLFHKCRILQLLLCSVGLQNQNQEYLGVPVHKKRLLEVSFDSLEPSQNRCLYICVCMIFISHRSLVSQPLVSLQLTTNPH